MQRDGRILHTDGTGLELWQLCLAETPGAPRAIALVAIRHESAAAMEYVRAATT